MSTYEQYLKFALSAPPHVKRLVDYFNANLMMEDYALSLPAALSVLAVVRSQLYIHKNGTCSNLYIASIAPSGMGKTLMQRAIRRLFDKADLSELLKNKPASEAGLIRSLQNNPRQLLIWDEFGIALNDLAETKATYKATLLGTMMELYSVSGEVYQGLQYAEKPTVDLKSPHLSIFAGSTPERFYDALSEKFISDGFLSRWIIVEREEPPSFVKSHDAKRVEPPVELVDWLMEEESKHVPKRGNMAKDSEPIVIEVPAICSTRFHPSVWMKLRKEEEGPLGIFWTRAKEIHNKLLILASEDGVCNYDGADWAHDLTNFFVKQAIELCRAKLFGDKKTKAKAQFKALLKPGETITRQQLTKRALDRKIQLSRPERELAIADFVESGDWLEFKDSFDDSQKKSTMYRNITLQNDEGRANVKSESEPDPFDDDSDLDI